MPSNTPNTAIPGTNPTTAGGKRKTARKPASSAPKASRKPAASQEPMEILFKDLPQPGREPVPPYLWIDHPQENERLWADEYVIRMGAGGAEQVDISVDGGAWAPCRLTSGYWWYDWKTIPRGRHTLSARLRTAGGQWYRTQARTVVY